MTENEKQEIENLKKALFILWTWNFNPEMLDQKRDMDWFYEFILEKYVKEYKDKKQNIEEGETKDVAPNP